MGQCKSACCTIDCCTKDILQRQSNKSRPEAKLTSISNTESEGKEGSLDDKTMELLSKYMQKHEDMQDGVITNVPNVSQSYESGCNESIGLDELEKSMTTSRVKKLTEIMDPDELKQTIEDKYTSDPWHDYELDSDDSQSSLSEGEKLKIMKMKSVKKSKSVPSDKTASLYRLKTVSDWDEKRIDSLTNDMEKQLITLTKRASQPKQTSNVNSNFIMPHDKKFKIVVGDWNDSSIEIDWNAAEVGDTHLFRNKSADKWDPEAMVTTTQEMRKEMISLMLDHQETASSSTY